MRARPKDLDDERLLRALAEWPVAATLLEYVPIGFGDHHWIASGGNGEKWFVTVADLDLKDGQDSRATLRSLRRAMDTAADLRDDAHLDFVVAPLRDAGGETVRAVDARYALSVFPFLDGIRGDDGTPWTTAERGAALDLLAALHRQAPPASAPVLDLGLPLRGLLSRALDDAIHWTPGPFTEPARTLLSAHARAIRRRLEEFDRLAEGVGDDRVLTHGEPHPGNLLRHRGRHVLVDWDTVGLAPPERDLWDVAEGPEDLERYAEASGRTVDASALRLYALRWDLDEVSLYVDWFRAPHERSPDTEEAWQGLLESVARLSEG